MLRLAVELLAPQFKGIAQPLTEGEIAPKIQLRASQTADTSPFMTVDSFALELYIKCLFAMDYGKEPPKGHDIKWFYKRLKQNTKQRLRKNYAAEVLKSGMPSTMNKKQRRMMSGFISYLNVSNQTFMEVRYLYEREWKKKGRIGYWPIMRFAARKTILDIMPDWA